MIKKFKEWRKMGVEGAGRGRKGMHRPLSKYTEGAEREKEESGEKLEERNERKCQKGEKRR